LIMATSVSLVRFDQQPDGERPHNKAPRSRREKDVPVSGLTLSGHTRRYRRTRPTLVLFRSAARRRAAALEGTGGFTYGLTFRLAARR
jgi:hypothetical protein